MRNSDELHEAMTRVIFKTVETIVLCKILEYDKIGLCDVITYLKISQLYYILDNIPFDVIVKYDFVYGFERNFHNCGMPINTIVYNAVECDSAQIIEYMHTSGCLTIDLCSYIIDNAISLHKCGILYFLISMTFILPTNVKHIDAIIANAVQNRNSYLIRCLTMHNCLTTPEQVDKLYKYGTTVDDDIVLTLILCYGDIREPLNFNGIKYMGDIFARAVSVSNTNVVTAMIHEKILDDTQIIDAIVFLILSNDFVQDYMPADISKEMLLDIFEKINQFEDVPIESLCNFMDYAISKDVYEFNWIDILEYIEIINDKETSIKFIRYISYCVDKIVQNIDYNTAKLYPDTMIIDLYIQCMDFDLYREACSISQLFVKTHEFSRSLDYIVISYFDPTVHHIKYIDHVLSLKLGFAEGAIETVYKKLESDN